MTRRSISTKERLRLFTHHGGVCHICGGKIDGTRETWDVEHVTPIALGGDESDENRKPAHTKCHKAKTRNDVRKIRKADRVHARHVGAKRSRHSLTHPTLKRKVSGEVVQR